MHTHGQKQPGTHLLKFGHQLIRLKFIRSEKRQDVFITHFGRMTELSNVSFVIFVALEVHAHGIPIPHPHALGSPMRPKPKLGIGKPLRALI